MYTYERTRYVYTRYVYGVPKYHQYYVLCTSYKVPRTQACHAHMYIVLVLCTSYEVLCTVHVPTGTQVKALAHPNYSGRKKKNSEKIFSVCGECVRHTPRTLYTDNPHTHIYMHIYTLSQTHRLCCVCVTHSLSFLRTRAMEKFSVVNRSILRVSIIPSGTKGKCTESGHTHE